MISNKLIEYGVIFREHHLADEFVVSRDLLYALNCEYFLLFGEVRRGSKKTNAKKKEIDDSTPRGTVDVKRQKMTLTFHAPKPRVLRGAITSLLFFLTRATDFAINYGPLVVFLFSSYYVRIL